MSSVYLNKELLNLLNIKDKLYKLHDIELIIMNLIINLYRIIDSQGFIKIKYLFLIFL